MLQDKCLEKIYNEFTKAIFMTYWHCKSILQEIKERQRNAKMQNLPNHHIQKLSKTIPVRFCWWEYIAPEI